MDNKVYKNSDILEVFFILTTLMGHLVDWMAKDLGHFVKAMLEVLGLFYLCVQIILKVRL